MLPVDDRLGPCGSARKWPFTLAEKALAGIALRLPTRGCLDYRWGWSVRVLSTGCAHQEFWRHVLRRLPSPISARNLGESSLVLLCSTSAHGYLEARLFSVCEVSPPYSRFGREGSVVRGRFEFRLWRSRNECQFHFEIGIHLRGSSGNNSPSRAHLGPPQRSLAIIAPLHQRSRRPHRPPLQEGLVVSVKFHPRAP